MKPFLYIVLITLTCSIGLVKPGKSKILFFGDSITYNGSSWKGAYINKIASLAEKDGFDNLVFVGSGVPGDRVTDLYLRLENDIISKSPDMVVIFIGVNDVWHKVLSGTGTDYTKFGEFYKAIVEKLEAEKIKVVVCTPTTIGEKPNFTNELDGDLNKYCQWIREYSSEKQLPLVDLRNAFTQYNNLNNKENIEKGILTADGVHLTPKGSELVAKEMWKTLKSEVQNK